MDSSTGNDVLLACTIGDLTWLKRGLSNGIKPTAANKEVCETNFRYALVLNFHMMTLIELSCGNLY